MGRGGGNVYSLPTGHRTVNRIFSCGGFGGFFLGAWPELLPLPELLRLVAELLPLPELLRLVAELLPLPELLRLAAEPLPLAAAPMAARGGVHPKGCPRTSAPSDAPNCLDSAPKLCPLRPRIQAHYSGRQRIERGRFT